MIGARVEGGVLTLTLNRPEAKNALDLGMVEGLRTALAKDRNTLRAVVLESGVPGYFSIGMDLAALQAGLAGGATSPEVYEVCRGYVALLVDLCTARCPVIASVSGMAVGGGVDLIASCDVVIAASDAVFSVAQLRKGIFPLTTSGVVIPRIGERAFLHWMLTGQNWSAPRALEAGLVSEVVPPDHVGKRTAQMVAQILKYDEDALRLGIDAVRAGRHMTQLDRLNHLAGLLALNCQIPRHAQGGPVSGEGKKKS